MGWWFEDYAVGRTLTSAQRHLTEDDVLMFAGLTGDHHPLHVDATYAATTAFGERIAHGLLGLGVAFGLLAQTGIFTPSLLALLEVQAWRFVAPVRIGSLVTSRAVVREARPSRSKPDRGIVTLSVQLEGDEGGVLQAGELVLLVRRRRSAPLEDDRMLPAMRNDAATGMDEG